jgi:hypothetical protein
VAPVLCSPSPLWPPQCGCHGDHRSTAPWGGLRVWSPARRPSFGGRMVGQDTPKASGSGVGPPHQTRSAPPRGRRGFPHHRSRAISILREARVDGYGTAEAPPTPPLPGPSLRRCVWSGKSPDRGGSGPPTSPPSPAGDIPACRLRRAVGPRWSSPVDHSAGASSSTHLPVSMSIAQTSQLCCGGRSVENSPQQYPSIRTIRWLIGSATRATNPS